MQTLPNRLMRNRQRYYITTAPDIASVSSDICTLHICFTAPVLIQIPGLLCGTSSTCSPAALELRFAVMYSPNWEAQTQQAKQLIYQV